MFMSGQEIYENFTRGRGPDDMATGAGDVAEVVRAYNERGDRIRSLLDKMDAVWTGDAAGAAHRGVGPLAVEHALAAPAMDSVRDLVTRQVGSFDDTKHTVVPVPPAPERVDPLAAFLTPGDLVTYQQRLSDHHAAAQRNVDAMRGYEGASTYNMNMPRAFGTITADQAEIRVAPPVAAPPPPSRPGDLPSPRKPRGSARGIGEPPSVRASGVDGTGATSPATPPSAPSLPPDTTTTPDRYAPVNAGPGSVTPAGHSGTADVGTVPGTTPGRGGPVGGESGRSGPGWSGSGLSGPGMSGPSLSGPSLSGPGQGGGRSSRGGSSEGESTRRGPGSRPRSGPMTGPGAAGAVAARTGRAAPGAVPMGAVPVGHGQDDDKEHQRASFLEEPDPEAVFGTDEPTAPPVIGG